VKAKPGGEHLKLGEICVTKQTDLEAEQKQLLNVLK
jgi:hypothetical protein